MIPAYPNLLHRKIGESTAVGQHVDQLSRRVDETAEQADVARRIAEAVREAADGISVKVVDAPDGVTLGRVNRIINARIGDAPADITLGTVNEVVTTRIGEVGRDVSLASVYAAVAKIDSLLFVNYYLAVFRDLIAYGAATGASRDFDAIQTEQKKWFKHRDRTDKPEARPTKKFFKSLNKITMDQESIKEIRQKHIEIETSFENLTSLRNRKEKNEQYIHEFIKKILESYYHFL